MQEQSADEGRGQGWTPGSSAQRSIHLSSLLQHTATCRWTVREKRGYEDDDDGPEQRGHGDHSLFVPFTLELELENWRSWPNE